MDKQIIGLVGPAGSGKTTLANLMVSQGFHRMRIAEPIKQMLRTLLSNQGLPNLVISEMLDGSFKETPSEFLSGRTPRHAMQTLGTEWRDLVSKELWIDIWEREVFINPHSLIVVDDIRFIHEAKRIRKLKGKVFLVLRSNVTSGSHVSEKEYTHIQVAGTITNDRDPPHMLTQMNAFLGVFK